MKKYSLIILIFFLVAISIFSSGVFASGRKIREAWAYNGDTFSVQNKIYGITFTDTSRIHVVTTEGFNTVSLGRDISINQTRIVYDSYEFDGSRNQNKVKVIFYDLGDISSTSKEVKINRDFESRDFFVGDEIEVKVTLENTNDEKIARNVRYVDSYPEGLVEVVSISGGTKDGSEIIWEGSIKEKASFSYKIRVLRAVELRSFKATLEYWYETGHIEKSENTVQIRVREPIELSLKFKDASLLRNLTGFNKAKAVSNKIFLSEDIALEINLTNKKSESINLDYLRIIIPDNIQVSNIRNLYGGRGFVKTEHQGYLVYSISDNINLNPNQSARFIFVVNGKKTGISNLIVRSRVDLKDYKHEFESRASLEIENKGIDLVINIAEDEKILEGRQKEFTVHVANRYTSMALKNIRGTISTSLSGSLENYPFSLNYLPERKVFPPHIANTSSAIHSQYNKILEFVIPVPITGKDIKHNITLSFSYETEHGEIFYEQINKTIEVEAIKDIEIKQTVSKEKIKSGEILEVSVNVKNKRPQSISNVVVQDNFFSSEFIPLEANMMRSRQMDIPGETEVFAYIYQIEVPEVPSPVRFVINTNVFYIDQGRLYNYTESTPVILEPKIVTENETITTEVVLNYSLGYSRTLKEKDIGGKTYVGQIYNIEHEIQNKEKNTTFYNVEIIFGTGKDFDVVGDLKYSLNYSLPPETTIKLGEIESIRAKVNETISLGSTKIIFYDKYGLKSIRNTPELKQSFNENPLFGPVLYLEKKADLSGNEPEVQLFITNIGDASAEVFLKDYNNSWIFQISPKETINKNYFIDLDEGTTNLGAAQATINYLDKNFTAFSEEVSVSYFKFTEIDDDDSEESPLEETDLQDETRRARDVSIFTLISQKTKDISIAAYNQIKKILLWRRIPETNEEA